MNRGSATTQALAGVGAPRVGTRVLWLVPLALALAALPWLTAAYAYQRILLAYGLIFGVTALGFNILLGYTGLLSFGHSAFFGIGAYTAGFLMKYLGLRSMEAYLLASMIGSAVGAGVFGAACVRYTRIFFSILTLALSQVLWALALKFFWITGGTDGMRIPTPTLLFGLVDTGGDKLTFLATTYYYYVLGVFAACVGLIWLLVHSPFGKALQAIRDNEMRAEFIGIRVRLYRWAAFVVSGVFTGVAGALWAGLEGHVTPDVLYWPFSGEIVFMTVLGGFKNFAGPLLGAVVFNHLKAYAVGYTSYWQALLGVVLVALVLTMPTGLIGAVGRLARRGRP
jgi:branched-chain amino acid transport system permease protein